MAWFSWLILSLNKIIWFTTLCLLYQAWGAKTTVESEKGVMEEKSLRNTELDEEKCAEKTGPTKK